MKKLSISLAAVAVLLSGCGDKPKESNAAVETVQKETAPAAAQNQEVQNLYGTSAQPSNAMHAPEGADTQLNAMHVATALETMDAAGYTYVKVEEEGKVYWIAGPQTPVQVGSSISYIEQMIMTDFTSKSMNRTFDYLMFATAIIPAGKGALEGQEEVAIPTHGGATMAAHDAMEPVEVISVPKAAGGYSVEELFTKKGELNGKQVKLQAKVVKVSKNIMGKDWIHLQDGSGVAGETNDLTVTALNSTVEVGDIVTAQGTLKSDVDLGYGYFFPVVLEESTFTK